MDLQQLRKEIDGIDEKLVRLFVQRMEVSARIADYKKENDLPVFVPAREAEKLQAVSKLAGADMEVYTRVLYSMLFELSRGYQSKRNAARTPLFRQICDALACSPKLLPRKEAVACLTEDHAHGQIVCEKFFGSCAILPFKTADSVLSAISQGLCRYGILPVQDNGKQLYDSLAQQQLYIVRVFRLPDNTRYLCIGKVLEIFPGADRCSICMALSDHPGALYKIHARLYTLGINVLRLESRPVKDQHFQSMFYFDLEASVYSEEFVQLICELGDLCEGFSYLGSYCEVV